jgi:hypothetical protein
MYRKPAPPDPNERPPAELVYASVNREDRKKPALAVFQLFSVPAIVGAALSVATTPTIALVGMIASAGGLVWWWRRAPIDGAVLRVDDGDLCVFAHGAKAPRARVPLRDLVNVSLDTRTIQPVQDGASAIPAMRFLDAQVGPEVDKARIVLVRRELAPIFLGEAYGAHMDASEWLGKIRVFLRKHGWVPEDERDPESAPPSG